MLPNFREQLRLFLLNPVFLACISSWLIAQFLKTVVDLIYGRIHSFSQLLTSLFWKTGGMPSSHSAFTTALCATIGFRNGIHSDLFVFSLAFLFVTVRDAFGIRRSSGLQAHKINEIGKELSEKSIMEGYRPLKEVNGHTPLQVILGCVLGLLIGLSYSLLK